MLATGILTWMILWMQPQGGEIWRDIETKTTQATLRKGGSALFFLAFLAVFREGVELALFLMAARVASSPIGILVGVILGLSIAIHIG